MTALEPVPRRLLRDRAYDALLAAIVSGELAPGSRLNDGELAERLGLSRAPVRQALARLATEGLVESKPQSFTRVAPVAERDVADALALVRTLHEMAVREALPLMDAAAVERMRAENARFAAAVDAGDTMGAMAADDALHAVPIQVCGNRALAETVRRWTPLLRRLECLRFSTEAARASVGLHEQLIDALAGRDEARAVAVSHHIWSDLAPGRPVQGD
ncbi:GntR family transcriptional regulator [Streptomyces sp. HB2AG]|uniref:GntR family transcriptional regulator n=1 Tax=Streptomyces sp. HB2AG TaxID=2983400 RepID=UPI0022AAC0B8|nr:GntR family transcriptional regulator [Streptomyces sp. HB2AG]MCZ2526642.1 GntR family transcriptional regulator [Streptomyces sp. HB2AG]